MGLRRGVTRRRSAVGRRPRRGSLVGSGRPARRSRDGQARDGRPRLVPVANLWIAKLIIDEVLRLARSGGSANHLWVLVALEMGTVIGGEMLARLSGLTEGLLSDLFTNRISIRIMEHAATLDLHQFE